jgi:hypothetical protein
MYHVLRGIETPKLLVKTCKLDCRAGGLIEHTLKMPSYSTYGTPFCFRLSLLIHCFRNAITNNIKVLHESFSGLSAV